MVTINRAVDHLIDVLAGEDVPVVGSKATRVDQLANMIADGTIVIGGGGNDDLFIVNLSLDMGTGTYTCDKTYAEIIAAATAGKTILGRSDQTTLLVVTANENNGVIFQSLIMDPEGMLYFVEHTIGSDDSITTAQLDFDLSSLAAE